VSSNAGAVLGPRAGLDPLQDYFVSFGGPTSTSIAVLAISPVRSSASRITASLAVWATPSSIEIFSSLHANRSAASSMRCSAFRFTCGALAPWKSHTLVARRAFLDLHT
jgi:hypothetical protein